jgi:DNA-binding CsgD family transcriptional regulator
MPYTETDNLIGAIYGAATDPGRWADVLGSVTGLMSGACAALHVHSTAGSSFAFHQPYNLDPGAIEEYVQHYYKLNPLMAPLSRQPVGAIVSDWELMPREEMLRTDYHRDYGRRHDMGGSTTIILGSHGPFQSCIGVVHGWRADPFCNEKQALLRRLAPHFRRAIGIGRDYEALRAAGNAAKGALDLLQMGVLLLDCRGVIVHANAAGEALLRAKDGLFAIYGKLYAEEGSAKGALGAAIREALAPGCPRGGFLAVPRGAGRAPLTLRVAPLAEGHAFPQSEAAARVAVFVTDPEADGLAKAQAGSMLAAYGLTAAEIRVVTMLAEGNSVQQAAEQLGIRKVTARNHLNRALAKTGVGRQAELMRLILSSLAPVI